MHYSIAPRKTPSLPAQFSTLFASFALSRFDFLGCCCTFECTNCVLLLPRKSSIGHGLAFLVVATNYALADNMATWKNMCFCAPKRAKRVNKLPNADSSSRPSFELDKQNKQIHFAVCLIDWCVEIEWIRHLHNELFISVLSSVLSKTGRNFWLETITKIFQFNLKVLRL